MIWKKKQIKAARQAAFRAACQEGFSPQEIRERVFAMDDAELAELQGWFLEWLKLEDEGVNHER